MGLEHASFSCVPQDFTLPVVKKNANSQGQKAVKAVAQIHEISVEQVMQMKEQYMRILKSSGAIRPLNSASNLK